MAAAQEFCPSFFYFLAKNIKKEGQNSCAATRLLHKKLPGKSLPCSHRLTAAQDLQRFFHRRVVIVQDCV